MKKENWKEQTARQEDVMFVKPQDLECDLRSKLSAMDSDLPNSEKKKLDENIIEGIIENLEVASGILDVLGYKVVLVSRRT